MTTNHPRAAARRIVETAAGLLRPPPKQTVSEWADAERVLSRESSSSPGRWRTSSAEYQRGIMDALGDKNVSRVVFMKSAQVGATEIILNALAYYIHRDPCPILVVQPTEEMAKDFSLRRLNPLVRDTPALHDLIVTKRSAKGANNIFHKDFPGGSLGLASAKSPSSLASRPIKIVLADEVDRYPLSSGKEGDALELAIKRTTTFYRAKAIIVSTPTIAGESRIEREFEASDKRYYYVPCPHCGEYQRLVWGGGLPHGIQFENRDPSTTVYICEHNGCIIKHNQKRRMIAQGEWRATSTDGTKGVAGFHISELYSPWSTWEGMVTQFLKDFEDYEAFKVYVNTSWGEPFRMSKKVIKSSEIKKRAEGYHERVPGNTAAYCVASVDVQADRLEYLVKAVGDKGEQWALRFGQIPGLPTLPHVWDKLDDVLSENYYRQDGARLPLVARTVDSSAFTEAVYDYVRRRTTRYTYAVKGIDGEYQPIVSRPSKQGKKGREVDLYRVGTWTAKDIFFQRIKTEEHGPNFQHYPIHASFDSEFFHQLVSEEKRIKYDKGSKNTAWVKIRRRNEALDLEVYIQAAIAIANVPYESMLRRANESIGEKSVKSVNNLTTDQKPSQDKDRPRPARRRANPKWPLS